MARLLLSSFALAVAAGCAAGPRDGAPQPVAAPTVTLVQRTGEELPGSGGRLRVAIGDVTQGQTLLRVVDSATGADVVPQRSMRIGDTVEFEDAGATRTLGITRLVNLMIGDDFVTVAIGTAAQVGLAQIDAMLERIAESRHRFVRDGEELDGPTAAARLRHDWAASATAITDALTFVDRIATRSPKTGDDYLVRVGEGRPLRLAEWLRGRLWNTGA